MLAPRTGFYRHAELRRLLAPASIAVIGASTRPGSFGERVLVNLAEYQGAIHAVNPRYERIGERVCHPSLAAIGAPVDCVVIAAAREQVLPIVEECAAAGAGGAIVFASGYAETGKPERRAEQDRLTEIARASGLRIAGPNTIGLVNAGLFARATFMTITPIPPGGRRAIGVVSQSGALGMSLAQGVARGASVSHVLTSGNSCDVDMADYIAYLAEDPATAAIACVFEGTSEPGRVLAAAAFAAERGKPLVVYKMATGAEGAAAAMSHTGALAGAHEAYRAAFLRAGAVFVDEYERLLETASFFAKAGTPKARGAAVLVTSGGAGIMAADAAEAHGVPLPQPDAAVRAVLESHIPEFGAARNPCDVTAQVIANPESLAACAGALLGHPDFGALVYPQVYSYEATAQRAPMLDAMAREYGKPICMVWITEHLTGPGAAEAEAAEHVALFRSMSSCFAALAAWSDRAARLAAPETPPAPTPAAVRAEAARLIAAAPGRVLTEREAKAALALYGVPVTGERLAASAEAAVAAAEALGYPVVLKVESPDLPHKTEAGVIRLDLGDAGAVRAAYAEVMAAAARAAPGGSAHARINGVLVQKMVPRGVELVIGARIDPLFGPLVVVGLGGVLVEVLKDTALALAPVSAAEAEAMLGRLRGARLLDGFRGAPAADRRVVAEVIAAVSRFAADHAGAIAELDVNPLIAAGERVVAVDALIVRRE
ncbi:MAG: acetate--CoA ligase family protein [Rhodospirillales bacterium]|nr:acetate--CoA ligase family protein [Rhodospirillales bacterium]